MASCASRKAGPCGFGACLQRPLLALAAAAVLLLFPATELKDLWLWAMAFGIGSVVGAVRGSFIAFQVDHQWHLIRMIYARVASVVAVVLAAVGALEIAASIAAPNGSPLHPILAACAAACAGFLIGRATRVGMRARQRVAF